MAGMYPIIPLLLSSGEHRSRAQTHLGTIPSGIQRIVSVVLNFKFPAQGACPAGALGTQTAISAHLSWGNGSIHHTDSESICHNAVFGEFAGPL